ncbi:hypothetical protein A2Y83_03085 [Candidatus Falkowbacteria bacterium RBG_13_39_14]|uniref:Uncharacterized protein n=1 Tax=Candidatus Falkowbacteria bacterium RBG_13_39_14 TaxID=1797985 RepID=A0A1F5S4Y4_9BACT|nr:MAG: hypothetical protein A2Y83_03085 [Candidatus Falkowbacteria bacterium RBG_13_39_14]
MLRDLANKNSELYKSIASVEKAQAAAQQFANQIKLLQATPKESTSSSTKFNAAQQVFLSDII